MIDLTEQEQLKYVKQHGWAIEYVNNPSEAVQLEAIKKNGLAIQYIKNPTNKVKQLHNMLYKI